MKKVREEQATLDAATAGLKSTLAKGWEAVRVADLAKDEPRAITDGPFGSNLKTEHYTDSGPRVVRLQNIGDGAFSDGAAHISQEHFARLKNHEARSGDLAIAMLGENLPRACLIPSALGPAIVKADCARLRVAADLGNPRFVMFALNAPQTRHAASKLIHGLGRPRLGLGLLKELPLPIGPRAEQDRVVEALDSYLTRLDAATEGLKRVEANLKRYRASVLKTAVEGRLVPTEAGLADVGERNYEPASDLLVRILGERRHCWEEATLADMKAKGTVPNSAKWRSRYEEPVAPATNDLPLLPEGWCWATIEQLARVVVDGDHNPPQRVSAGIPHLTAKNVKNGFLQTDGCTFVSLEGFEQTRRRYDPIEGDVIVTCVGTIGSVAVVPSDFTFSADRNLAAIRAVLPVQSRWLKIVLGSPRLQQAMTKGSGATAQPHLYLGDLRSLAIPLAPLAEQVRIVEQVERALGIADHAAHEINRSVRQIDRLRQSVLSWAFEGKLVDQDPEDEPVLALLRRIREERDAAPTGTGRGLVPLGRTA